MNEPVQIDINIHHIPTDVGIIEHSKGKNFLKSLDIPKMKERVFGKKNDVEDITFLIIGTMHTYVGIQLGIWLGPMCKIVYKSPTEFTLELDSVI